MSELDLDKRIRDLRAELSALQATKRRRAKAAAKTTTRRRGRPSVPAATLHLAKQLAFDFPIPDVARKLNIGLSTLYDHGIKRYRLNAELRNRSTAASSDSAMAAGIAE